MDVQSSRPLPFRDPPCQRPRSSRDNLQASRSSLSLSIDSERANLRAAAAVPSGLSSSTNMTSHLVPERAAATRATTIGTFSTSLKVWERRSKARVRSEDPPPGGSRRARLPPYEGRAPSLLSRSRCTFPLSSWRDSRACGLQRLERPASALHPTRAGQGPQFRSSLIMRRSPSSSRTAATPIPPLVQ